MISVIIPVYRNTELLIKNLRNNLPYLKDCEIIIVNDDPEKSLKNLIDSRFRGNDNEITLIENNKNLGFGESINQGVKKAKGEYLMLLNSDVLLTNNNYQLATRLLTPEAVGNGGQVNNFQNNPSLFAVSFAQKEKDGTIVGKNEIYWKKGFFQHKKSDDLKTGPNGWAEGGSSLIDKKKFLELGGFDKIYAPFYWEDIDLSHRAKKRGWSIIFDPKIEVVHHHESTIGKYYDRKKIETIAFRNQLIFTWRNLTCFNQKIEHCYYLIIFLIKNIIRLNFYYLKAFVQAINSGLCPG